MSSIILDKVYIQLSDEGESDPQFRIAIVSDPSFTQESIEPYNLDNQTLIRITRLLATACVFIEDIRKNKYPDEQ